MLFRSRNFPPCFEGRLCAGDHFIVLRAGCDGDRTNVGAVDGAVALQRAGAAGYGLEARPGAGVFGFEAEFAEKFAGLHVVK